LREEPYEPRSSVRPGAVRPADPLGLADSEDERGGIGENFCQPPPLLPPLSRTDVEPPELPGLGADPEFELPRVSAFWPKRWDPLLEPVFELPLPGLATSRPFPVDRPSCRFTFETCDCPRSDERDAAAVVPRAEKKC